MKSAAAVGLKRWNVEGREPWTAGKAPAHHRFEGGTELFSIDRTFGETSNSGFLGDWGGVLSGIEILSQSGDAPIDFDRIPKPPASHSQRPLQC
jgi:hypothetical protein